MATFQELMDAAVKADKAGDTQGAQTLVDMAKQLRGTPKGQVGPEDPNYSAVTVPQADGTPTRSAEVDRFGDTIEAATRNPRRATAAYARGVVDQSQSPSMANMPEWVPENMRSGAARVADTAMTGVGALGTSYAFGVGLAGEALGGSPTREKQLARDLMMAGEVAIPQLAGLSGAASRGARASGAAGASSAVRNTLRGGERPTTPVQETARAADDLGITPSLGAGGKVRSMTSAALEKTPIAGASIAKDATRFVDEVEGVYNRVVSSVGRPVAAASAGEELQGGLRKFVVDFKEKSGEMFDAVGQNIPRDVKIDATNTVAMIRELDEVFKDTPEIARQIGLTNLSRMADDLEGGVSWQAATALRTEIGKSIGKMKGALTDQSDARLKRAYETLTADLEAAAIAAGPEAERAWRRANNYYRRGAERIEQALDKTIKADSPERAFEAFAAMTRKDRSSSDATRLYKIKASMPQREWETVAASIVDRLGRATSGQQNATGDVFSPARFLTEWNNLSTEAKAVLLPPEARSELTKLARVAEGVKRANADRNFSNTGGINQAMFAGMGFGLAPTTTTAVLGGATIGAKAMTSRRFLSAMNRMARGDDRAMRALAKRNDEFAEDARTILRISAAEAAATSGAANDNQTIQSTGAATQWR